MKIFFALSVTLCFVGIVCDIAFLNTHITYLHHIFQLCIVGGQLGILIYLLKQKRESTYHNEKDNAKQPKTPLDNAGSSKDD